MDTLRPMFVLWWLHGQEEAFTFPTSWGTVIRDYFVARYDFVRQVEEDRIILEEYQGDALIRRAETHETLTWYFPREIRLLARTARLRVQRKPHGWAWMPRLAPWRMLRPKWSFLTCSQAGTAGLPLAHRGKCDIIKPSTQ